MSRGQLVNVAFEPFTDLQMMEHTWHRVTRSGICFSHGSYAAQRLDNDVDLNETRKIIHLDVGI